MNDNHLRLTVNGRSFMVESNQNEVLASVLRDKLGLTGTKVACNEGVCGSCTVLVGGKPIYSCMKLAWDVGEKEIVTIEGLARNGKLSTIQQSFLEIGAAQCGFCTTGFIMSAKALLDRTPNPGIEQVKQALSGNICRCTDYTGYVQAVLHAVASLQSQKKDR
jgi:carbon-monoxide dehydrogenase small subunit